MGDGQPFNNTTATARKPLQRTNATTSRYASSSTSNLPQRYPTNSTVSSSSSNPLHRNLTNSTSRSTSSATSYTSRSGSYSSRNPFRNPQTDQTFQYSLDGEEKEISQNTYRTYQNIFDNSSSEPVFIPYDAALGVLRLSRLHDDKLGDIWDDALRATHRPNSLVRYREGFLNKDEFFILLNQLQAALELDDRDFEKKCLNGADATSWSVEKEVVPERPEPTRSYTDGLTEYTQLYSPGVDNVGSAFPSPSVTGRELLAPMEPVISAEPSSYWVCHSCSLHNFGGPPCDACGADYPEFSGLIVDHGAVDRGGESSGLQTASVPEQDSFKEIFTGPEGLEVVEPQDSFKELSVPEGKEVSLHSPSSTVASSVKSPVPSPRSPNKSLMPRLSVRSRSRSTTSSTYELEPSFATKESDAQALKTMKALEPKNSSFSMKRIGRGILDKNADKGDKASSGYSFEKLAESLVSAAEAGNLPLVASFLKLGADVNYSSPKTRKLHAAMQRATRVNQVDIVDFLLKMGANEESAANALNLAIRRGSTEIAMRLVPHADFNRMWRTSSKWKPFDDEGIDAVPESFLDSSVQESCLSLLVGMPEAERNRLLRLMMDQPRFDPDKPAKEIYIKPWNYGALRYPMTILDCFAESADLAGVEFLLQLLGRDYKVHSKSPEWLSGAKPVYRNPISCISIHSWATRPDYALKVASLLVKHGASVPVTSLLPNDQKQNGDSPLVSAIAGRSLQGVEFLLANGADPECIMTTTGHSFWGLSPLSYAATYCEVGICRAIVEHGATPWRSDATGKTPLYHACKRGNLDAVEYFLSVDVARSDVNLCLQAAIDANEPGVARLLVAVGARATAEVWEHAMSAKRIGKERFPYFEIIDLLCLTESSLDTELVLIAIDKGNLAGLSRVLEKRDGILDFEPNEIFADKRWFDVPRKMSVSVETADKEPANPAVFLRRDWQNCLAYAEEQGAEDFVNLLKSYNWVSRSKCLCGDGGHIGLGHEPQSRTTGEKSSGSGLPIVRKQVEDTSGTQPPPYRS